MLECLVMGDSIAVGVSYYRKECKIIAKSGINSGDWKKKHLETLPSAKNTIISLGSNDWDKKTFDNLHEIRSKIQGKVYWILPSPTRKPYERKAVVDIANAFGDVLIERPKEMAADGIHPTMAGYKDLAERTK